eukprot:Opistho-2@91651
MQAMGCVRNAPALRVKAVVSGAVRKASTGATRTLSALAQNKGLFLHVRKIAESEGLGSARLSPRVSVAKLSTSADASRRTLVVGLGNHGLPITHRHSIGMVAVNRLADSLSASWQSARLFDYAQFDAPFAPEGLDGLVLVRPKTFMNLSGGAVAAAVSHFKTTLSRVLIVHDDLERDLSKTSFKAGGSANGHNGIRSICTTFKTQNFPRLRIGIGRPERMDTADYVLSSFDSAEASLVNVVVRRCGEEIVAWHRKLNDPPAPPKKPKSRESPRPNAATSRSEV